MGENEAIEAKAPAAMVPAVDEKSVVKAEVKKDKKKDKKPVATIEATPHVTGRLLHVEVDASGVAFAIKGKKGKADEFSLKGMESFAIPSATALLAGLVTSKSKVRVEFSTTSDNVRVVKKIRAHS
jgi:hypothetical protein